MNKKIYILSIEYNEDTEEVEYIQEEIVDKDDLENKGNIENDLTDYKYWDEDSLKFIRKYYTGEIGES